MFPVRPLVMTLALMAVPLTSGATEVGEPSHAALAHPVRHKEPKKPDGTRSDSSSSSSQAHGSSPGARPPSRPSPEPSSSTSTRPTAVTPSGPSPRPPQSSAPSSSRGVPYREAPTATPSRSVPDRDEHPWRGPASTPVERAPMPSSTGAHRAPEVRSPGSSGGIAPEPRVLLRDEHGAWVTERSAPTTELPDPAHRAGVGEAHPDTRRDSLKLIHDDRPGYHDPYGIREPPEGGTVPYAGGEPPGHAYLTDDHRWARPRWDHLHWYGDAHYGPPPHYYYGGWYSHWWCHPYYRYTHYSMSVVYFDFTPYAWSEVWVPPYRTGWVWMPGYWAWGYWHPGYWAPVAPPPLVHYVYVPGYWSRDVYVEGYYRSKDRRDGDWSWVEGYYLEDGTYVPGHWRPNTDGPEGYVWEPGFFDGETYIDGFWRPEYRPGYRWVGAWWDEHSIYHAGFWEPVVDKPDHVWIPGWFDGNEWVAGYWVPRTTWEKTDARDWQPEEGWDAGWEVGTGWGDGEVIENRTYKGLEKLAPEELPIAIPVIIPKE